MVRRKQQPPLTAAQSILVEQNMRLVHKIANQLFRAFHRQNRILDYDDAVQYGMIGLIRAVQLHDGKSSAFSTYAWPAIKSHILRGADQTLSMVHVPQGVLKDRRKRLRGEPYKSKDEYIDRAEYAMGMSPLSDHEPDRDEPVDASELEAALGRLGKDDERILRSHYGLDGQPKPLAHLARNRHVSRERLRQRKEHALGELREMMG